MKATNARPLPSRGSSKRKKASGRKKWLLPLVPGGAVLGGAILLMARSAAPSGEDTYRLLEILFASPLTAIAPPVAFFGRVVGARRTTLYARICPALLF